MSLYIDKYRFMISRNIKPLFIALLGASLLLWWLFIAFSGLIDTKINYFFGVGLGILPVVAALFGFKNGFIWGGFKSAMGKTLYFLAAGLMTWGIGTLIFAFYNLVLDIAVPYPSIADVFYIVSWPLWTFGMISLSNATGARFRFGQLTGKLIFFLIPLAVAAFSYYLLITVARGGSIATDGNFIGTFVSFAYVLGDVIILTITLLIYGLSFRYLGGYYKWSIFALLIGFGVNYIADFFFALTTTKASYFVGDWVDLIFTVAFFLLGLAVTLMDPSRASSTSVGKESKI